MMCVPTGSLALILLRGHQGNRCNGGREKHSELFNLQARASILNGLLEFETF